MLLSCYCPTRVSQWSQLGQVPEVLRGGGEQKLVARSTWSSQAEASEPKNAFEMGEEHLDLFSAMAGSLMFGRCGKRPGDVARILMQVARDFPRRCVWAATRLHR